MQWPQLTVRSSGRNREAETPDGGSNTTQTGDGNSVLQIGSRHDAETNGDYNETMQDGSDHESRIDGDHNLAAQSGTSNIIRIGTSAAAVTSKKGYQYGKKLCLRSLDATNSIFAQMSDTPHRIFHSLQDMSKNARDRFNWLKGILRGVGKS